MKEVKIGDFGRLCSDFRTFEEIQIHFFAKVAQNCPESPILNSFTTNSDWQESENSKNGQFFKNDAIFGDLTHLKMNNFFQCIFIA